MDMMLLGVAALVLIALTLWIVWRPTPAADQTQRGDEFEDRYTSATADLSAGGVALATSTPVVPPEPVLTDVAPAAEAWPAPAVAAPEQRARPRAMRIGGAALLTLTSAVGGAWLYSRWRKQRNKPLNRLRRRFR